MQQQVITAMLVCQVASANYVETHPSVYEMFDKHGLNAVGRSNRYWAGLSTVTIEQTMM